MNEITIGDKIYISAKRAAEITGYARDYVGQLCREGHVDAKMVGRSWYVFEPSIRAHRFGPESVPAVIETPAVAPELAAQMIEQPSAQDTDWKNPTYTSEAPDMLPELTAASLEELMPPAEETLSDMQSAWREWFDQKQKVLEVPEIESPEVIDARNESYEEENEPTEASEEAIQDNESDGISVPLQRIEEEDEEEAEYDLELEAQAEEIVPIHHIEPAPVATYQPAVAPRMDIRRDMPSTTEVPVRRQYNDEFLVPQAPLGRVIHERVITKKVGARKTARLSRGSNAPIIAVLIGISLISITVAVIGTGYASRYLRTLPAENNPVINFLVGSRKISN